MRSFTYKRRNPIRRRRRQMGGFDGGHYTPADIFHDAGHSDIVQVRIGQIVTGNKDSKVEWNPKFGEARTWEYYKNELSKDLDYKKRIDNIVTFSIPGDTDLFGGNNKEIIFNYFGITDIATQPLFIAHDAGYPLTARINAYAPQGTYYAYDVVTAGTLVDQATRQHHPYSVYPPNIEQAIAPFKGEDYFGFSSALTYTFTIKTFNGTVSTCDMAFKNKSINGDPGFTNIKDIHMKMGYSPFPFLSNDNVDKLLTYQKESIKDAIQNTIPAISADLQQAAAIMGKFMGDSMQVEMYIRQLLGRTDSVVATGPAGVPLQQLTRRNQETIDFNPIRAALNTGDQLEFVRCMKRKIPSLYSSYVQREEKRIFFAIQGEGGVQKEETKEGLIARFTNQFNDLIKLVSKAYITLIADLLTSIGGNIELANNTFDINYSMYQGANLIADDKRDLAKRYIVQCIQAVYKLGLWTTAFYISKRDAILAQENALPDAQTYLSAEYNKLSILASNVSPQQTTLRSKGDKSRLLILVFKVPAIYTDEFPQLSPIFAEVNAMLTDIGGRVFQPELEVTPVPVPVPVQYFSPQKKSHTIYLVEAYNGINKNNAVSSNFTKIFRDTGTLPAPLVAPFSGGARLDNIPTITTRCTVTFDNQNDPYYTTEIPDIDENGADDYRLRQVEYMLKDVLGLPNMNPDFPMSDLVWDSKFVRDYFHYDLLYDYFMFNFYTIGHLVRNIRVLDYTLRHSHACFDETLLERLISEASEIFPVTNHNVVPEVQVDPVVTPEMIEFNIFATKRNYWTLKETPVTESDEEGSLEQYLDELYDKYNRELDRYNTPPAQAPAQVPAQAQVPIELQ